MKKIGIIGGGISGLAAAFLLKSKGFEVTLFEKSVRVGVLRSNMLQTVC
jgi:phytoene dehydrogenase-like protein